MMQKTGLSPLLSLLRCLECQAPVEIAAIASRATDPALGPDGWLACTACAERYPVIAGTPRMLDRRLRASLFYDYPRARETLQLDDPADGRDRRSPNERTLRSFAYEWKQFGTLRPEWRKNFLDYAQPHSAQFFAGKLVLDVGAGSGRHSAEAAALGARVVAVDMGPAIDISRRNLTPDVLTVQADAQRLPFAPETFDFVMSIGVLHHLPDTRQALGGLVPLVAPSGHLHVYLYWVPELRWHRAILRLVNALRRVTVRLPHRLLHLLCYPVSAILWLCVVAPYRSLRTRPRTARLAAQLPLKAYADYPFTVLVNDQFDRFSAPVEQRFTRDQVQLMLERAGLEQVVTIPNHGWVGDGQRPLTN